MATIHPYTTASGTRYRVTFRTADRRQTTKRGFRTKRDAREFAATVEHDISTGSYVAPAAGRQTVAVFTKQWEGTQAHLAPKTKASKLSALRVHVTPRWGDERVGDILPVHVRAWVAEMDDAGVGAPTIERAVAVLRQSLAIAVEARALTANPAVDVALPRRAHRDRVFLTHAQVTSLAAASTDEATILLLAYTGLRFGEAAALRLQDVNPLRRRMHISRSVVEVDGGMHFGATKTGRARDVPYPRLLDDVLAERMAGKRPGDLVLGAGAAPVRVNNWRRRVLAPAVDACQKADIGFPRPRVHDLRHTAASLAIQAGANVKTLQRMLGHASAAMTLDRYGQLYDDDLDAVAAALDRGAAASRQESVDHG